MEEPELQPRMQLRIFERSSRVMAICMKNEINPVRVIDCDWTGGVYDTPCNNKHNFGASLGSYSLILEYQLPFSLIGCCPQIVAVYRVSEFSLQVVNW